MGILDNRVLMPSIDEGSDPFWISVLLTNVYFLVLPFAQRPITMYRTFLVLPSFVLPL